MMTSFVRCRFDQRIEAKVLEVYAFEDVLVGVPVQTYLHRLLLVFRMITFIIIFINIFHLYVILPGYPVWLYVVSIK